MFHNDFLSGGIVLMAIGAAAAYFRKLPMTLFRLIERTFLTIVEVRETDESFFWMKLWLAEQLAHTRSLSVFTRRPCNTDDSEEYEAPKDKYSKEMVDGLQRDNRPRVIFVPAPGIYWMFYKGKFVTINADRSEISGEYGHTKHQESFNIRFYSRNRDIPRQMLEEARDLALPLDGCIEVRVPRHNYWNLSGRIQPRTLDSVILDGNIAQNILDTINTFLNNRKWYDSLGIPHRLGCLFYGPPGSGKSSLALAIASHFNMNVYSLNLGASGLNDSSLNELLGSAHNGIVVIEDIDCAFKKRKAGEDRSGKALDFLTFSGVLNALDGIGAHQGIVFMTTNHIEKLDEALIREGRMDLKVHLDNASHDQIERLFRRFYPESDADTARQFAYSLPERQISMAKIQGYLRRHQHSPEKAVANTAEITGNVSRLSDLAVG